jgi:HPt (histidine-containing phosphotransfer) domain-containing protein
MSNEQLEMSKSGSVDYLEAQTEEPEIQNPKSEIQNVLDPDALERLLDIVEGEHAILVELIDTFLEEAPVSLDKLRQAIAQDDAAGVRLMAHALKSSSNDFGAGELAALCQALEDRGRAGNLVGAEEHLAQIEAAYARVKLELEKLREE